MVCQVDYPVDGVRGLWIKSLYNSLRGIPIKFVGVISILHQVTGNQNNYYNIGTETFQESRLKIRGSIETKLMLLELGSLLPGFCGGSKTFCHFKKKNLYFYKAYIAN
jgi:hypothetical protein